MGFRRFTFRGVTKVRDEWDLACAALNRRRLQALGVMAAWPAGRPRGDLRSVTRSTGAGAPSERL